MKHISPNATRLARGALLGLACLTALALSGTDLQPPTGIEFRSAFIGPDGGVRDTTLVPTTRLEFRPEFISSDGQVTVQTLEVATDLMTPDQFIDADGQVTQSHISNPPPGLVFTELRISDDGTVLTPNVQPPDGLEYPPIFIGADGDPGTGATSAPLPKPKHLLELDGAWPNPFNPALEIRFRLHDTAQVRVDVFDVRGALVRTLLEAELAADLHVLRWDGRDAQGTAVASGSYVIRVRAGHEELSTKAMLLK